MAQGRAEPARTMGEPWITISGEVLSLHELPVVWAARAEQDNQSLIVIEIEQLVDIAVIDRVGLFYLLLLRREQLLRPFGRSIVTRYSPRAATFE